MIGMRRREFATTSLAGGLSGVLSGFAKLPAADMDTRGIARFSGEIEPLVRFIEETPRGKLIEETAVRVSRGLSYRQLLAALLLAGVRNVQPRPSVGFKFHAVLVVNSAHLAAISGPDSDRWLPIFWALDNFKSSQARDEREGDWTLPAVDEASVPPAHQAGKALREALESWDESAADVAITSAVRNFGSAQVFEWLAPFAARDYRSIGHKVIYLSNAFRTLDTIGWEYAEPVMRSLVYAMLNHVGQPNPSKSDLDADRPGKINREKIVAIPDAWTAGKQSDTATAELIATIRGGSPEQASDYVVEALGQSVSLRSIWDGLFSAAAETMMRQRGIVALHAVTTSNAIHHAFQRAADPQTRKYLLLQNASMLPMFLDSARSRGAVADRPIDGLVAGDETKKPVAEVSDLFTTMGTDRGKAAEQIFAYLQSGGGAQQVVDHARRLIFLKGSDSHDYKFSSAALEDYRTMSPVWRDRYLAAAAFQLRHENEPTRNLVQRIRSAIG